MIDPRIPLMVQAPDAPKSPLVSLQDVMTAREKIAQMQEAARKRADLEEIRRIYAEVGVDPRRRPELAERIAKVNPIAAQELVGQWQKEDLENQKAQLEQVKTTMGVWKEASPAVRLALQAMGNEATYGNGRAVLGTVAKIMEQAGLRGASGLVAQIPEAFTPESAAAVKQLGMLFEQEDRSVTDLERALNIRRRELGRDLTWAEFLEVSKAIKTTSDRIIPVTRQNEKGEEVTTYMPETEAVGQTFVKKGAPPEPVVLTERPDPETGDERIPGLGATPNSIWQNGIWFAVTGKMPTLGMGSGGGIAQTRQSIMNTASALMARSGLDAQTIRSAYQANQKSLDRMVPLYNQTAAFANSAKASLQYAIDAGDRVWNSKIPTVNRMRNWLSGTLAPNEKLSAFEVFVYTAARDYAKVTSGGALSIAELSVAAAQKADQLLNSAQSPEQFSAAAGSMLTDMGNVMDTQREQIGRVSDVIRRFLDATNPAPISVEDLTKRVTAESKPTPAAPAGGGQTFTATTVDGRTLEFPTQAARDAAVKESAGQLSPSSPSGSANVPAQARPPANPTDGQLWRAKDDNSLYRFDATTRKWIEVKQGG